MHHLTLTDEIKTIVLDNYRYEPEPKEVNNASMTKIINNYNILNNYVVGMDFSDKLL